MSQLTLTIENSINEVLEQNILIGRNLACFKDNSKKPYWLNALGAVLYANNFDLNSNIYQNLKRLLKVDDFWLYRWNIGWDVRNILQNNISKNESPIWVNDDVSALAYSMSKKYVNVPMFY